MLVCVDHLHQPNAYASTLRRGALVATRLRDRADFVSGLASSQTMARARLTIENGCIRLGEGAESSLIVWPSSAELVREGERIVIRDRRSGDGVAVGDLVEMGGGEHHELNQTHLTGPVPATCRGPYWAAASGWQVARSR
jgi:hypothetical protein